MRRCSPSLRAGPGFLVGVVCLALAGCVRPQARLEQRVAEAINAAREAKGLEPLGVYSDLTDLARSHSLDMLGREELTHRGSDGLLVQGRLDAAPKRIDWVRAGENVARNKGFDDPVAEAVRGWMDSPPHRANVLDRNYRETGVGVYRSRRSGYYYITQVFLLRMPEGP